MTRSLPTQLALVLAIAIAGCTQSGSSPEPSSANASVSDSPTDPAAKGIFKLEHLIFIVQENRSFDNYFATYPGADGPPPDACVPDPVLDGKCLGMYHSTNLEDDGGPHGYPAAVMDVNHGKMDGFIRALFGQPDPNYCAVHPTSTACVDKTGPDHQPDVMGYHDRNEIPNYWDYADNFVLQDRMFAPVDSFTLPSHLFLVSAWSARCSDYDDPMSCKSALLHQESFPAGYQGRIIEDWTAEHPVPYAWTDITWLLHKAGVSWAYYVAGKYPCILQFCATVKADRSTPYMNPLPGFRTVNDDGQLNNITPVENYFSTAEKGTLPSVSWVMPAIGESEHPGRGPISNGQAFVTKVVNAAMQGPDWNSTAVFVTWDDWGGFYDHVQPPHIDENGYGLRVPGLMISPYAKQGYIDHQTLSFDAYLKLIEDRFLDGQRLDPKTDGRPDARPTVREDVKQLGDLSSEFDFTQAPREPLVLDPYPKTDGTG